MEVKLRALVRKSNLLSSLILIAIKDFFQQHFSVRASTFYLKKTLWKELERISAEVLKSTSLKILQMLKQLFI